MGTSILVLSKSEIPMQILRSMLPHDQYPIILFCSSIVAARQLLLKRSIDLLIIDMPLTEESGLRFAQEIAARSTPGLLLLMNSSFYHQLAARMEEAGIPVLKAPFQTGFISECTHPVHAAAAHQPLSAGDPYAAG